MLEEKEIILDYLKREQTDYALLIDGAWGSGKTYFWKNIMEEEIKNKLENDLKSIYISLYGINNLEEINKNILLNGYNFLETDSDLMKASSEIGKTFFKAATSFFGVEKATREIDYKNFINLKETVLCFDDLERCNISVEEVMGYINKFVEHDGMKTIIIANEAEIYKPYLEKNISSKIDIAIQILKNNKDNDSIKNEEIKSSMNEFNEVIKYIFSKYSHYKKIKEKLIGKTIEFNPNKDYYKDAINKMINNFSSQYKDFLKDNREIISNIFNRSENENEKQENKIENRNLRSLKQGLSDFKRIYFYGKENNYHEILNDLLKFTLSISFEIKSGDYSKEKLENLMNIDVFYSSPSYTRMKSDTNKKNYEEKRDFRRKMREKYYYLTSDRLYFSTSIFQYVMKGFLNEEKLEKEIKDMIENKKDPSNLELLSNHWWNLQDDEFDRIVYKVIKEIEKGEYKFGKYPKLFRNMLLFVQRGILNIDVNELKDKFKIGIKNSIKEKDYKNINSVNFDSMRHKFNLYMRNKLNETNCEIYKEFIDFTIEEAKNLYNKQKKEEIKRLIDLMNEDSNQFFNNIHNRNKYIFKPIFKYIEVDQFIANIKNLRNAHINDLSNFLAYRYEENYEYERSSKEYNNLYLLKLKIKSYLDVLEKTLKLRRYLIQNLLEVITNACNRIEKDLIYNFLKNKNMITKEEIKNNVFEHEKSMEKINELLNQLKEDNKIIKDNEYWKIAKD